MPKSKDKKAQVVSRYSSGGAVFRKVQEVQQVQKVQNATEWLLINPRDTDRWQLPKGTIDPGEKSQVTAVREVFEETGVKAEIIEKLETIRYFFTGDGERIFKSVVFYLMKSQGEEPKIEEQWAHEIAEAKWFAFEVALEKLTYKDEKALLKKAQEKVGKVSQVA